MSDASQEDPGRISSWILRGMPPLPMSSTILSRSGTYLDLGRRRFSIAERLLFPMDYLLGEGLGWWGVEEFENSTDPIMKERGTRVLMLL